MAHEPALEPDEIIPPDRHFPSRAERDQEEMAGRASDLRGLFPAMIAKWLDNLLRVPGTNIKIGLDPILALIPGFGDAASTSMGATILLSAVRHRAPVRVLIRMAGNMIVNALLNLVPFAGPAASIWFKSNLRNNELLQNHLDGLPPGPPSTQSRVLLTVFGLFVLALMAMSLLVWVMTWKFLAHTFGSPLATF